MHIFKGFRRGSVSVFVHLHWLKKYLLCKEKVLTTFRKETFGKLTLDLERSVRLLLISYKETHRRIVPVSLYFPKSLCQDYFFRRSYLPTPYTLWVGSYESWG